MVEDNGKGFKMTNEEGGHGPLNIKSRISAINGEVSYDPSPGTLMINHNCPINLSFKPGLCFDKLSMT